MGILKTLEDIESWIFSEIWKTLNHGPPHNSGRQRIMDIFRNLEDIESWASSQLWKTLNLGYFQKSGRH
ncbi:hypothetical protein Bpfe_029245 [Biomphalaria pfeifferi]|uniref:Uncharacterized protein n=1 Tax=Biomphalaria pfeifferi TaxID=112525 RepID=A0AAD8AUN5_BIOPF|nr:hypothetical protein Bpfe_029245 [Biomphalaria pfeifferi]